VMAPIWTAVKPYSLIRGQMRPWDRPRHTLRTVASSGNAPTVKISQMDTTV
jgi:hypothetical protein